jgi:hypothetical protein
MPHFWMTYRDSGRLVGVVIMDAPSLIQAAERLLAKLEGQRKPGAERPRQPEK